MLSSTKTVKSDQTSSTNNRHSPITSSLQEHSQFCGKEAHYEAWTNHAASLEHREWWRDLRLATTFLLVSSVGIVSFSCAYSFGHEAGVGESTSVSVSVSDPVKHAMQNLLKSNSALKSADEAAFVGLHEKARQFIKAGRLSEGIACYLQAASIQTVNDQLKAELFNDLGVAEHEQGNFLDSIAHFKTALKCDPEMSAAQRNLVMAERLERIEQ